MANWRQSPLSPRVCQVPPRLKIPEFPQLETIYLPAGPAREGDRGARPEGRGRRGRSRKTGKNRNTGKGEGKRTDDGGRRTEDIRLRRGYGGQGGRRAEDGDQWSGVSGGDSQLRILRITRMGGRRGVYDSTISLCRLCGPLYYYLPTPSFLCTFLRGYMDKPETGQDRACPSCPLFRGVSCFPAYSHSFS